MSVFGFLNKLFRYAMVYICTKLRFLSPDLFQMSFCRLCTYFLKGLSQFEVPLPNLLCLLPCKNFTSAVGSQVDNSHVNSEIVEWFFGWWFWRFNSGKQVENIVYQNQVGLSLNMSHTARLITTKNHRYQLSSTDCPQTNCLKLLEGHNSLIVNDGSQWLERNQSCSVSSVRIDHFAYCSYGHLRSEIEFLPDTFVDYGLYLELGIALLLVNDFGDVITGFVETHHRVLESDVLLPRWTQFDFKSRLHLLCVSIYHKGLNPVNSCFHSARQFLPRLKPWASLPGRS